MKRSVLVTGATGFSGKYLCGLLTERGYRVIGTRGPAHSGKASEEGIGLDISNEAAVHKLIRSLKPLFICHLAAQSSSAFSWENPQKTFAVNTAGTVYLLNAVRAHTPRSRVLFISSSQVYGMTYQKGGAVDEKNLLQPQNPYAASKALTELACLNFAGRFGLDVVVARPTNHVGAGQSPHFVFSDWCRQIARAEECLQKPVLQIGDPSLVRDFLHVKDVVGAYEILLRRGKTGEVYNISSGRPVVLRKYLEFLLKKSRISIHVAIQKERLRSGESPQMNVDVHKIKSLGWRPEHSIFTALEELLAYWRRRV